MSDETRMVLEMLREGRITAAEAANLLEALGGRHRPPASNQDAAAVSGNVREEAHAARRLAREAKAQIKEELRRARAEAEGVAREIREEIESEISGLDVEGAVEGGLSRLGSLVSGLVGSFSGGEFSFPESISGELPQTEVATIAIRGVNGRITVMPADPDLPPDRFELKTVSRLRASSQEEAQEALPGLYTVQTTPQGLVVAAEKVFGQSKSVSFALRLPASRKYALELNSTNGSVEVGELDVTMARVTTTNGKIRIAAQGDEFVLHSTNGRVEIDGCASQVSCGTVNGRVVYACQDPVPGKASLSTVNGSIRIFHPDDSQVGLRFFGETRTGSLRHEISGGRIVVDEKRRAGRKLHLERSGEGAWLEIEAKSVVGSISLSEE